MRKRAVSWLTAMAATTVIRAPAALADDLPKTEVSFVGTWANLSVYKEREHPFWAEEVPAASGGQVTADVKAFTELGLKGGEVFRLMKDGVIDFGSTVLGYVAGDDPENEAVDLAGFTKDIDEARAVVEAYKPALSQLYADKYGIRLLAVYPFHAQMIYCRDEISGIEDLAGKKVRVFSKSLDELVTAVGGTPITLAFAEVIPALQKGVADCAITGALSGNLAKWSEVTNYLYTMPVGWSMVMMGVNQQTWNGLDPSVQAFLSKEVARWEDDAWKKGAAETQRGIDCNTGKACEDGNPASMTAVEVTEEELAKLRKVMETVIVPNWAKRCGAECAAKWNETVGKVVGMTVPAS